MVSNLEKRLIALSHLGIRIEHTDGHRWILSTETDNFDYATECEKQKNYPCKVYGGINEALDKVDSVLVNTDKKSLLNVYNNLISCYDDKREDYIITCTYDLG